MAFNPKRGDVCSADIRQQSTRLGGSSQVTQEGGTQFVESGKKKRESCSIWPFMGEKTGRTGGDKGEKERWAENAGPHVLRGALATRHRGARNLGAEKFKR